MKYIIMPLIRLTIGAFMLFFDTLMSCIIRAGLFVWTFSDDEYKELVKQDIHFFYPVYRDYFYHTFKDFVFNRKIFKK